MNRQEQFESLRVELEQNWKSHRGENSSARGPENPLGLIGLFAKGDWEGGEVSPELDSSELTNVANRDYGSDLTEANKRLMAAAKRLNLDCYPRIQAISGEKKHRVVWHPFNPPQPAASGTSPLPPKLKRVVVVGKVWLTEAAADFMAGANDMARHLGVELVDSRGDERLDGQPDAATRSPGKTLLKRVEELKKEIGLRADQDAILDMFDLANKLKNHATDLKVEGFHVVTTSASGTVRKEDGITGRKLADQFLQDHKTQKGGVVLVVRFGWTGDDKSFGQRGDAMVAQIEKTGRFKVRFLDLKEDEPPMREAAIQATELLLAEIENHTPIVAVFPRSEVVTGKVIGFIRRKNLSIRVYSERLLATDLRLLAMPGSPLEAVCGVSFYSYGRYALRVAAYRWPFDMAPNEAQPILVTREEALKKKICSLDRLFSQMADQDPELEDSKFCWHPDMPGRRVKGW